MQCQEASFEFSEKVIDVEAVACNTFPIKIKGSVAKHDIVSDADWVKILSPSENMIYISIAANEQKDSREGKITVTYGNNTKSVIIKQKGKAD